MRASHARSLLLGLLLAVGTVACESGTTGEAEALVRGYLAQLADGTGDRGWSLLHPMTQQGHFGGDVDNYVRRAEETDWSAFDWQIGHVERDEPGSYEVVVLVDGEPPPLITQLATFQSGLSSPGPTYYVRFNMLGGSGIYEPGS
jgi:hypothetical protein